MITIKKRKDECTFCKSRKCHNRVVTFHFSYDEIACKNHTQELSEHQAIHSIGKKGIDIFSTKQVKRGGKTIKT